MQVQEYPSQEEQLEEEVDLELSDAKVYIPLFISEELDLKMKYLSDNFEKEIGGWIIGEYKDDGIYLNDLLIPEQEVSSASVDINAGSSGKLVKEFKEKCTKIIGHWHSHCKMGCFWSYTDENNMEEIMKPRKRFLFIVSSKGEHKIRLELKEPFRISVDDMQYELQSKEYDKIRKKLEKEISKKVIETSYNNNDVTNWGSNTTTYSGNFNKPDDNEPSYKQDLTAKSYDPSRKVEFFMTFTNGATATYRKRNLIIEQLSEPETAFLMEEFKEMRPLSAGSQGIKMLIFNIKNSQKAEKIATDIEVALQDFNEDFYSNPNNLAEFL